VRAGTDRDSVLVSIGLLRESLRGQRKFGCLGAKSRDKRTGEKLRVCEGVALTRRRVAGRGVQSVQPTGVHCPKRQVDAVMLQKRLDRFESVQQESTRAAPSPFLAARSIAAGEPSMPMTAKPSTRKTSRGVRASPRGEHSARQCAVGDEFLRHRQRSADVPGRQCG
jgi:hypothetical protein